MRLTYFGGPAWDAGPLPARGRGQETLLFRLAIDAGTVVSARALTDDLWANDAPDDPRAALQSLISRLRRALGAELVEAVSGGYRLTLERDDVDLTRFQDLVAHARRDSDGRAAARAALALWSGEPWVPEGFDWARRDLLEDRAHAERIAGAATTAAGAPAAPTAPRTASATVPAALAPLIGRTSELTSIAAQLEAERLVTVLGPGGAGKTTLALETARRTADALFVELAPAAPAEVWAAIAAAAGRGIRLTDSQRVEESDNDRVIEALRGREMLVVLDNCEHVSAEAASVARELLTTLPGVRILTTSREPLGVPGEAFVPLGPLAHDDAVELFARRVRAARGAAPEEAEAESVSRIVRRLDGMPLALELAAAKARTLTLDEIDAGLDDRFALLSSGPRAADPRHQTLRALIDWSWEPLPTDERTALTAASVFPDGIGIRDVTAVAGAFEIDPGAFDALVDRSLLTRANGRLRLLETVREYGLERLRDTAGEHDARLRAATVLARLGRDQDDRLRGPGVKDALAWFDANDESLSAAIRFARDAGATGDDGPPELRTLGRELVRVTVWPYFMRERFAELRTEIELFARGDGVPESEAAVVLDALLLMLPTFTAPPGADALTAEEVVEIGRRAVDISAGAARHRSDLGLALAALVRAAARSLVETGGRRIRSWNFSARDDEVREAPAWTDAFLTVLDAASAQNSGDAATLDTASADALQKFTALNDPWGLALASQMRSEWLVLQGRLDEALAISDAAAAGLAGLTSVWDTIQQSALTLGILVRLGRFEEAHRRLEEVRRLAEFDGSDRAMFQFRTAAASVALAEEDADEALRHLDTIPPTDNGAPEIQLRAWTSARRAQALVMSGRHDDARAVLREALPLAFASDDQPIAADVVLATAGWLVAVGRMDAARRAVAASVRLRGGADQADPAFARLRAALGDPDPDLALRDAEGGEDLEVLTAFLD
ncbi:winged helix-turn-helix domain-containing protein [Microbacterium sp. VKM Ac-2870]|uniref:ATP-binding protein n=1 Tax=Microbacterium sp. VKM Ac-2870 TaxID=2783825 RepID=UPI00188B26BC|nr:NB-ARC domain-containing protein [Microbacterium sp. VKM Ac-2870]MBF4562305.1 winged helix-turn-helix domain-containing protein [Microbacterium sp. VKM Ac-2870]